MGPSTSTATHRRDDSAAETRKNNESLGPGNFLVDVRVYGHGLAQTSPTTGSPKTGVEEQRKAPVAREKAPVKGGGMEEQRKTPPPAPAAPQK
jgi:hypothetical protein